MSFCSRFRFAGDFFYWPSERVSDSKADKAAQESFFKVHQFCANWPVFNYFRFALKRLESVLSIPAKNWLNFIRLRDSKQNNSIATNMNMYHVKSAGADTVAWCGVNSNKW